MWLKLSKNERFKTSVVNTFSIYNNNFQCADKKSG